MGKMDKMRTKKAGIKLCIVMLLAVTLTALSSCTYVYNVTYEYGYDDKGESVTVTDKESLEEPIAPERLGYNFEGWYNGDEKWEFGTPIDKDIVLTARWSPKEYTASFNLHGGECEVESMTVKYDERYTLPQAKKEGWYFAGWHLYGRKHSDTGVWNYLDDMGFIAEWSPVPLGTTVYFGRYEQDNDIENGAEAIKWLVIDKKEGQYLMLSDEILDAKWFDSEDTARLWRDCDLRAWLGGEFYETAFNESEKAKIVETYLEDTETYDKVFLLNTTQNGDLIYGSMSPREGTAYAKANGLVGGQGNPAIYAAWWLRRTDRDPEKHNVSRAPVALGSGYGGYSSSSFGRELFGVRPAIWVTEEVVLPYISE